MRYFSASTVASCFVYLLSVGISSVQAQTAFAGNGYYAAAGNGGGSRPVASTPPESTESVVLMGKITNPAGVLPGAVIILTATRQMAVTNADGEFQFVVPANAGPLQALVTYAGYADEKMTLNASADESTVNLTNARIIVVSRKQQLKTYLKTARKEAKRSLKQVHKATE